jgi:hypothetical protein
VARTTAIAQDLDAAERLKGAERGAALTGLASQLDSDAAQATDQKRVAALAAVVRAMAADPAHAAG